MVLVDGDKPEEPSPGEKEDEEQETQNTRKTDTLRIGVNQFSKGRNEGDRYWTSCGTSIGRSPQFCASDA